MSSFMTPSVRFVLRSSIQALLALTALSICRAQDASQETIIARIDGKYTISFADVQQYIYDSHLVYKYRANKAKAYHKAVDEKIVNQLKLIDFFASGLNDNAELLQGIRREINEELVIRYFETQFYQKYVNEDSVRNAYRDMGSEVVYQQIVLAKPKHASRKVLTSLRSRAKSIRDTLHNGADFAEVAKNYSQSDGSSRPGDLIPVNWKMSLLNDLNYTIFHLAAREAHIIENKASILIVKVAEVRQADVPPYELAKEDIQRALRGKYEEVSLREFEQTKEQLIDEKTLAWNSRALRQLARWSNISHFYKTGYSDTLRNAIAHGHNLVILTYPGGQVDFSEYLRLLNDVLIWGRVDSVNEDNIKKYILEAVRTDMLVKKANALNLEKDIFHPTTTNPVLRNEILRLYDRHEIDDRIPVASENALRDFYQAHKDSLFYQLAKVNIYAVIDSSKRVVEEAKHKLERSVPFERLAPEIFVKTYVRGRDGTFDSYLVDEPPYLAEAAFKLKLYETAGPIEFADSARGVRYALIKCMAIREEKQLTYEDVEKTITDAFTNYYREEIARAVQDRLREKYTVTVYTDVLDQKLASIGIKPQ